MSGLESKRGSCSKPGRAQAPRILAVEDLEDSAELMAVIPVHESHLAHMVQDGPPAIVEAKAFRPYVLLCGIGLPGMSGYGVAELP